MDGRGPATILDRALSEHFEIAEPEQILYAIYDREFPRTRVAKFAARVDAAARAGDAVAAGILADGIRVVCAASSVRDQLGLEEAPYDVVLSGGTFAAVPSCSPTSRAPGKPASPGSNARNKRTAVGAVNSSRSKLSSAGRFRLAATCSGSS